MTAADAIRRWRETPSTMVRELFHVEPDAWQMEALDAFPSNPRMALQAPIALDASVPTPNGVRRWGDIRVGDVVLAENGMPTKVRARHDVGVVATYRVRFTDHSEVDVSGDHLWKVQTPYDRKIGVTREMTTAELAKSPKMRQIPGRKSGQNRYNIPVQGIAQFSDRSLPLDPYILGLWIGDGSRNEPAIICPDPNIRAAIEGQGFKTSIKANGKTVRVLRAARLFEDTGILHLYSHQKFIPDEYKFSAPAQRLDLLRGMMDADGTVAKNGHTYYASSSERLIDDFMWLGRSLGYMCSKLGPYRINGGMNRDSFRVVISGPISPFHAQTKKASRWHQPETYRYTRYIESIDRIEDKECMCIEVEDASHCFLIGDFIVTHNCKGPGKTTVLAWLCWNFLLTRPHPKIAATSISADNLADGLWTEMAKWRNESPLLLQMFQWTKTRIFANDHPETWYMTARTWAKSADKDQQANTLAGLHADYILFVLDESGGIPDSVMAAAEAALATGTECHIVQAGNPTHLEGPLYRAATNERRLWYRIEITGDPDDPKRSPRVSVKWAREQIEKYGRENPFVLVNVFGKFPPSSFNSLIGPDEANAAMKRFYRADEIGGAALVLGVDVARYGHAKSVIRPRRGIQVFPKREMRNVNSTQGAGVVARMWADSGADACFIDTTGGFGAGWYDQLQTMGRHPIGIQFSQNAHDMARYVNKRAEMAFDAVQWIKDGGALPDDAAEIVAVASSTRYTFQRDRLILEPKEDIEARVGFTLDDFDAWMLTFAEPVQPKGAELAPRRNAHMAVQEWNPFAESGGIASAVDRSYDPYRR